jgi:hypothetical protein
MQVFILGKSTDPSTLMFTRVDIVVSFDSDINNGPDDVICPMNVCGRVAVVYPDMPEYGQYCGFDIKTAFWVKELGWTVDFCVPVLVPPRRCFEKTPIPHVNSLITVYVSLFGRDRKSNTIVLALKDFAFLPRSLSSSKSAEMTEQVSTPGTPQKQIWVAPRHWQKQIIWPSPDVRNTRKCLYRPVRSVVPEIVLDPDDSYGKCYHYCISA